MQMPGPNIYHPATIDIQISDDNEHWTELYHLDYPATVVEPYNFKDFGWRARKGSVRTRYIHYKANCSEIGGFQFTDEIIVR
jgi:hexosaminidase